MRPRRTHRVRFLLLLLALCLGLPTAIPAMDATGPSLEDMVGQMLMAGFRGYTVDEDSPIVRDITDRNLGGVILFNYDVGKGKCERNIDSPAQVKALIASLQSHAETPLFVAVDQEGGKVQRLRADHGFTETPSAAELGRTNDTVPARRAGSTVGVQLHELGFNLDFAPVADVNVDPESPAIGAIGRSFSSDPHQVAAHARAFSRGLGDFRVLSCLKHFPGHGSAHGDSHQGVTDVSRTWKEYELQPYRELLATHDVDMIMAAHVYNRHLDPDLPASLSHKVITGLLREKLGYDGVVITDDMQMRAVTDVYGFDNAVLLAVEAGADVLLFGNNLAYDPDAVLKARRIILQKVKQGVISKGRILRSYERIMRLKQRF